MINSLRLINFKNFADETLCLGPFSIIVGANASGKSNIRDAFRVLNGIGRGYTLAEILGGKDETKWKPIRGAGNEIARFGSNKFSLEVESSTAAITDYADAKSLSYEISIERELNEGGGFRVVSESLKENSDILYRGVSKSNILGTLRQEEANFRVAIPAYGEQFQHLQDDQPVLRQLNPQFPEVFNTKEQYTRAIELYETFNASLALVVELLSMQFLELSPDQMRQPTFPDNDVLGARGENLPAVLHTIWSDPERKDVLISWLRELTPMDVEYLEFPADPSGRIHMYLHEVNGRHISAYSASDGTLRFLGILAALLGTPKRRLFFFEEIDNGIHPSRLWLLNELIEQQTAKGGVQVIATTHSPDALNFINDSTFESTSVVYRDEHSADAVIRSVSELPNARELRKTQGLGRLHCSGWMETALAFTEGEEDASETKE